LLVVRAVGRVDDQGRAPAGCFFPLKLVVQRQPGAPAVPLAPVRVEVSFDDGATWRVAPGGTDQVVVHHPAAAGFVSLRITARDIRGNSVVQTVIRAYQTAVTRDQEP
jgi:hypothetical protein